MRKIKREELVNNSDFENQIESQRRKVEEPIRTRKIPARSNLEFQFMNPEIFLWELQNLLLDQNITREDLIDAELSDINKILPTQGSLCCRLRFSFNNSKEQSEKLMAWKKLPDHISLYSEENSMIRGTLVYPEELERTSKFLIFHFPVGTDIPTGLKVTLPGIELDYKFSSQLRENLKEDLHTDL